MQERLGFVRPFATRDAALRAFSLAELLVVVGVIALLIALLLPPLQLARQQAVRTQCAAHLRNLWHGLEIVNNEHGFYPLPDDAGTPIRYTWIDVLVQTRAIIGGGNRDPESENAPARSFARIGYCPADGLPDALNVARHPHLLHPRSRTLGGVDYSYGIGVPLAFGGWAWQPAAGRSGSAPRRFVNHTVLTANRVLAGDAIAAQIYNLSGFALESHIWNDPTQFDNTVAWSRHQTASAAIGSANLLYQDGHVVARAYQSRSKHPVNTSLSFVWQPGEPIDVNPGGVINGYAYPNKPPPMFGGDPPGDIFPHELVPRWYTANRRWTLIQHK